MVISNIEHFLEYWERVRFRTRRVATCIPPEQMEWTYAAGKFTLGDLVRHIAAVERYMFVECVMGRQSCYPGHGRELADGYEAVLAYLDRMDAESIELLRTLMPEQLQGSCPTPAGAQITTWKWLRSMAEHEIHHRGQIYVYLSMLGSATPPLYGLTEEQVRERSQGLNS
jgi:uncharacterized damage-inducible protein DinB